jgi:hypothetical protein
MSIDIISRGIMFDLPSSELQVRQVQYVIVIVLPSTLRIDAAVQVGEQDEYQHHIRIDVNRCGMASLFLFLEQALAHTVVEQEVTADSASADVESVSVHDDEVIDDPNLKLQPSERRYWSAPPTALHPHRHFASWDTMMRTNWVSQLVDCKRDQPFSTQSRC